MLIELTTKEVQDILLNHIKENFLAEAKILCWKDYVVPSGIVFER